MKNSRLCGSFTFCSRCSDVLPVATLQSWCKNLYFFTSFNDFSIISDAGMTCRTLSTNFCAASFSGTFLLYNVYLMVVLHCCTMNPQRWSFLNTNELTIQPTRFLIQIFYSCIFLFVEYVWKEHHLQLWHNVRELPFWNMG